MQLSAGGFLKAGSFITRPVYIDQSKNKETKGRREMETDKRRFPRTSPGGETERDRVTKLVRPYPIMHRFKQDFAITVIRERDVGGLGFCSSCAHTT